MLRDLSDLLRRCILKCSWRWVCVSGVCVRAYGVEEGWRRGGEHQEYGDTARAQNPEAVAMNIMYSLTAGISPGLANRSVKRGLPTASAYL